MTSSPLISTATGYEVGCYISYAFGMVFMFARVYTRYITSGNLGLDDFFIVVGALMCTALIITVPPQFRLGVGQRLDIVPFDDFMMARKWAWVSQIFYYTALGSIKCAIISLYHRLASKTVHKRILKWFGAVTFLHGVTAFVTTAHMCDPVEIIWKPSFPIGCIDILSFNYFNAAFHIITDLIIAVLPIPILKDLHLSQRKKLGLIFVFSVGALTIFCTIARQVTNAIALNKIDFTWHWAPVELCTNIEVNMGLICACIPALRPLFNMIVHGSSTDGSSGAHAGYELKGSGRRNTYGKGNSVGKSQQLHSMNGDGDGRGAASHGYTTRIFARKMNNGMLSNNESEEHIVAPSNLAEGRVLKNVEYSVEYSHC